MLLVDTFRDAPDYFWNVLQCCKKKPRLPPTISAEPTGPDPVQHFEVLLPGSGPPNRPKPISLSWDFSNQHTMKWDEPICVYMWDEEVKDMVAVTIRPGSLNLYMFPKVFWAKPAAPKGKGLGALISSAVAANKKPWEVLEGSYLKVLQLIFKTIAESPTQRDLLKLPDASGACSVLGLLVANNQAAIDCVMGVYKEWPDMIAVPHLPGFFVGENAFHVLAANSQEATLCELIQMAYDNLPREKIKDCFTSQALGLFFSGPPMNQYGGTPIGYAASFCMRRAIALYLSLSHTDKVRGFIDLNSTDQFCQFSGFSPMHAAVCNGYTSMYDFLVDLPDCGLKETLRGDEKLKSGIGTVPECLARYASGLTPLQLACQLGDHRMFEHILKRSTYSSILWKWGPVTQFQINLDGIDSAGGMGGEVLELIGRFDAKIPTQEMLLDEFMEGMLNGLFVEKWERFGERMWSVHRLLDICYLMPLVGNALWLKEDPLSALKATWLPMFTLLAMIPCLSEDVRAAYLWYTSYTGPRDNMFGLFMQWCKAHMITDKVMGCALTAVGCVALLNGYKPAGITDEMVIKHDMTLATDSSPDYFPLWIFLSIGILIEMMFFFDALTKPNQEVGILFIMIARMLGEDIAKFMKVFMIVFINYGFAMYICYPRTGDVFLPQQSPEFNSLSAAVQTLMQLALLGDTPKVDIAADFAIYSTGQMIEFTFYIFFLFLYLIMALILLLNLLIAMMGDTFGRVQEQAVREYRVSNCQMLLRLELLARGFFTVNSGEQMGDNWYVLNRVVEAIEEGGEGDPIDFDTPDEQKAALAIPKRFRQKKAGEKPELNDLSDEQLAEFREAFALFDKDGDQTISAEELGTVMRALGQNPTPQEVQQMIDDVDENGDGTIDFDEFKVLMQMQMTETDQTENLTSAFKVFDVDGSGSITKEELHKIMTTLGEPLTDAEVDEMMKGADKDGSGTIEYKEFVNGLMGK